MVYKSLTQIDPEGVEARLCHACVRRVYRVFGPNHIWACDGHNKLKKFGICVYGFIDAWSRKILGMFVHTTNNDPKHVGVYFLHLVSKIGGIPLKVTSDFGTETGHLGTYQMWLSARYAGITTEEAEQRMHFTKSTHNQKIEALWSQMMKQHNASIKHNIKKAIHEETYDPNDKVQKLLFLFIWIPVFQSSVDMWVDSYNQFKQHQDRHTALPTGCTADYCYSTPESEGTTDQLVRVPTREIESIIELDYPDLDSMFEHTPPWFHELASRILEDLGYELLEVRC
ncbi:hypothetical protein PSTG_10619 [Puccinia striiformis f. sp. tritici PST-78]|uniref:Integrase core domain-containing protein n=1 Tax=Puccinia striiformis f. sp. tritici PST-78 TaxID=1165861 RepID=A0A0L0V9T2_9BASI|nr:hypothetical protein PSTG_10619 [Puccinia striiformis f. sp. tritici PST-78]